MQLLFVNCQQLFEEKLAELSSNEPVIAIFLEQNHALLGALIQLLKINLADVLLGKASTDHADIMLLTFSDLESAQAAFQAIPACVELEGQPTALHVQLWSQGVKHAETSCAASSKQHGVNSQTTSSLEWDV
ncbi:hypothetical protein U14_02385 [Candidatus Moduliflexus flocculans]|uniref:Uncharacterized protein n=1 Tax=Candidatus Moduliflexus flocculans TaxID=1499966 RepID=A0A081BL77_9BACT|nr:hypothetical protein U14_02385 [Candidatus Moduliflexus flocculans]